MTEIFDDSELSRTNSADLDQVASTAVSITVEPLEDPTVTAQIAQLETDGYPIYGRHPELPTQSV